MKSLRVAVWGLGPHALKNILPALREAPGLELAGVCTRNTEVLSRAAERFACRAWSNADSMLRDPEVDAVFLSTPIGLHVEQGLRILGANKHFWCEKPLADSASGAEALARESRARCLSLAEGFMYLYHPQFAALRTMIHSEKIGKARSITFRFGIPKLERPGFRDDPRLGGGAFWDVGCYPISASLALFPEEQPQIVLSERVIVPGETVDRSGRALLRYKSGCDVQLEWGTHCAYRNEVDIWGTQGSVFTDRIFSKPADYVPRFVFNQGSQEAREESGKAANHFVAMFDAFRKMAFNSVDAENERIMITRRTRFMTEIYAAAP